MKSQITRSLYILPWFVAADLFAQNTISGKIVDENDISINDVLVVNISNNKSIHSNLSGQFVIEAEENDEIRFVKEGYYRSDKKISRDYLNSPLYVHLLKAETLIPEVKISYKPTGNLERNSKYYGEGKRLAELESSMEEYMRSPLKEPLPKNTISQTFTGHNFSAGQIDLVRTFLAGVGLIKKAVKPKITKPDYNETINFISRIKLEINLDFMTELGMDEEQIDQFLVYANDTRELAKKYRKNFKNHVIESELKIAFKEYRKTNTIGN
ncbi:hypothetical protein [Chryseobacterium populi]|uniref:Carboxypeptidase regulatory-like domain-containing protein n=1 Tax=Chryseobacterium populi TaxID=1144316 RepID=J3CQ98_9FLAO|nr:hypothetical protein [Chryseobacterium populi]EJL76046.1 hypothetical protein PMI13_00015 [Chryseobacterium populi]